MPSFKKNILFIFYINILFNYIYYRLIINSNLQAASRAAYILNASGSGSSFKLRLKSALQV